MTKNKEESKNVNGSYYCRYCMVSYCMVVDSREDGVDYMPPE